MTHARFNRYFLAVILAALGLNFFIWKNVTSIILPQDGSIVGDLARMSYRTDIIAKRTGLVSSSQFHHEYFEDIGAVDLITIGDSFSNGLGTGLGCFYQDMISKKYDLKILNLGLIEHGDNPIENILMLLQTKEFSELTPKYILLQVVERKIIDLLAVDINWNVSSKAMRLGQLAAIKTSEIPPQHFLNASNLKVLLYPILYQYDDNAYISKAYMAQLSESLFSSEGAKVLSFYFEDLLNISKSSRKTISYVVKNLNHLARILQKKGIKLIFMPTVDKYNLYSEYIVNNPYPKSSLFELFREASMDFAFVDTKYILSESLSEGVKDLYYSDDTHWSEIGMATVVEKLADTFQ